jgi:cytoskeletal protein CcmA (bactofilin family)
VTNDVLVVGDRARIDADITCGTVIVHGEVNGNIKAKTAVELHAPAKVRGDVETPSFSMEKGVVFQGQSTMPAEPATSPAARPQATAGRVGEARAAAAPLG